jgi:hypothetical protein
VSDSAEKPETMAQFKQRMKDEADSAWWAKYGENHWDALMGIYGPWDDDDDFSSTDDADITAYDLDAICTTRSASSARAGRSSTGRPCTVPSTSARTVARCFVPAAAPSSSWQQLCFSRRARTLTPSSYARCGAP